MNTKIGMAYLVTVGLLLAGLIFNEANAKPRVAITYRNNGTLLVILPQNNRKLIPADHSLPKVTLKQIRRRQAVILWGSSITGATVDLKLVARQPRLKARLSPDAGRLYVRWTATQTTVPLEESQFRGKARTSIVDDQIRIGGYIPPPIKQAPAPPVTLPIPSKYKGNASVRIDYYNPTGAASAPLSDQWEVDMAITEPKTFIFDDGTAWREQNPFSLDILSNPLPTGLQNVHGLFLILSFAKADVATSTVARTFYQYWDLSLAQGTITGTLSSRPPIRTDFDRANNIISSWGGGPMGLVMLNRFINKGATITGGWDGTTMHLMVQGTLFVDTVVESFSKVTFSMEITASRIQ